MPKQHSVALLYSTSYTIALESKAELPPTYPHWFLYTSVRERQKYLHAIPSPIDFFSVVLTRIYPAASITHASTVKCAEYVTRTTSISILDSGLKP
jgi:hypothetical protein